MKNSLYQSLLRLRGYLFFALLTTFVISIAYLATEKPVNHDSLSANAIPEVADYVRDFEDNADDNQLFIIPTSLNQAIQLNWTTISNTSTFQPSFTKVSYRARPRSPPVYSLI
ncbi:MAG: hypothetical protein K0U18_08420 [Betaproteobacteria bacterium]|nr:hypothetical protein [Betaproteobacteria bacterium]MCH9849876.1 hypothetical protein [Betaproteobacteria bacterium]